MKDIVRFGVLSALLFATSLPAFSAPSDSDMGFAGGREPSASDVGYQGIMTRGYRDNPGESGPFDGAAAGQSGQMHRAQENSDKLWFDNHDNRAYLQETASQPYRANPYAKSQTMQAGFQGMTQGQKQVNMMSSREDGSVGMNPLALQSVSGLSFRGPQNLGFRDGPLGFGTFHGAMLMGGRLPKVGTGSVNASICAPDGKQ